MMMNNIDFETQVRGRLIKFPVVDGLSELEMGTIVGQVTDEMKKIEDELGIVDTSKVAIIAAYSFAARFYTLSEKSATNREADSKKLDDMVERLERTLAEDSKS